MFSKGVAAHPNNPRMYRHRGHRYITTRQFDRAIADFEKAATLIKGTPDEIEPDGAPNPTGKPRSSLHFNIWYHLGLAHYLKGDYQKAAARVRRVHEGVDQRRLGDGHQRLAVDDADAAQSQGRRRHACSSGSRRRWTSSRTARTTAAC